MVLLVFVFSLFSFFSLIVNKLLALLYLELMMICSIWFFLLDSFMNFFFMCFLCGVLVLDSVFCISLMLKTSRDGFYNSKLTLL